MDGVNPTWCMRTGRLDLRPVCFEDLDGLVALKADPLAFGLLLGGVRDRQRTAQDLAVDIAFWGRYGVGMWSIRERGRPTLIGMTGIMQRPDGRGMALRFALQPHARGRGYASEASSAALRYAHEHGRLARVIAVARETNTASRELLAAIGMTLRETFIQHGWRMWLFESVSPGPDTAAVKARAALVPA